MASAEDRASGRSGHCAVLRNALPARATIAFGAPVHPAVASGAPTRVSGRLQRVERALGDGPALFAALHNNPADLGVRNPADTENGGIDAAGLEQGRRGGRVSWRQRNRVGPSWLREGDAGRKGGPSRRGRRRGSNLVRRGGGPICPGCGGGSGSDHAASFVGPSFRRPVRRRTDALRVGGQSGHWSLTGPRGASSQEPRARRDPAGQAPGRRCPGQPPTVPSLGR